MRKLRVLHVSHACHPDMNSEEAVGWNRAKASGKLNETVVICHQKYQAAIESHLVHDGPVDGVKFHFVESPISTFVKSIPGCYYLGYRLWLRDAYRVASQLHNSRPFDIMHHVSFCGYREPGYLHNLDVPTAWGPIGGTQNFPTRFFWAIGPFDGLQELFRSAANQLQLRWHQGIRHALNSNGIVYAANSTNQRDLERLTSRSIPQLFEAGTSPQKRKRGYTPPRKDEPLRIVWSGHAKRWKALPLLLRALADLPHQQKFELRVIGKGPRLSYWKRLAERMGLGDRIVWLGYLSVKQSIAHFEWAHLLAFTSLRDTTGSAMFQALNVGLPIMCLNHQGAADIVQDSCGVKIAVENPEQSVRDIRAALLKLASSPQLLLDRHLGAMRRAHELTWDHIELKMLEDYRSLLKSRGCRVDDDSHASKDLESKFAESGTVCSSVVTNQRNRFGLPLQ